MTRRQTPARLRALGRVLPAALALALTAPPLPLAAQESSLTPPASQRATKGDTAAAPAATPAPIPDGWTLQSYFGLDFALPAGFELIDSDVTAPDGIFATLGYYDEAADRRDLMMILFAPPGDAETMLDDFDGSGATGARPSTRTQAGGMTFSDYRVTGSPNRERPETVVRTRLLVGSEPNALGWVPAIMLAHSGEPPLATEAEFDEAVLASLRRSADPARYGVAELVADDLTVSSGGKPAPAAAVPDSPAAPAASAETEVWQTARDAGNIAGVLAYLERWPQGSHAAEARDWLHARAIVAPGDAGQPVAPAPAAPAPAPSK